MSAPVTRFAPSPTGRLHLGHALAARVAWGLARAGGGRFLLRIEDLDPARSRPEFTQGILDDLAWLGLGWDGPVMIQSARADAYRAALDSLRVRSLVYPCFCTRKAILAEIERIGQAPHGPDIEFYPGTCRALGPAEAAARLALGEAANWRLDSATAAREAGPLVWHDAAAGCDRPVDPADLHDVVLARKDALSSYHLAVVVDDAAQGVTLVTRGDDLASSTPLHTLLQRLLSLPPPAYNHHPLATTPDGRRLAKRDQDATLAEARAQGLAPRDIFVKIDAELRRHRRPDLARLPVPP